ncbi:MAG: hypothetical protein ACI845_003864 [Gammaproteobacteria bacterium]|jgi:hypothetical protein
MSRPIQAHAVATQWQMTETEILKNVRAQSTLKKHGDYL